jgi:hypothetical protein
MIFSDAAVVIDAYPFTICVTTGGQGGISDNTGEAA